MEKKEILTKIKEALKSPIKGVNSMGCGERYYDKFFLLGDCFTEEELNALDEKSLNDLLKLANFAGEVFY